MDVFLDVFDLPHSEREATIRQRCQGNDEVLRQVAELLHHHDAPDAAILTSSHPRIVSNGEHEDSPAIPSPTVIARPQRSWQRFVVLATSLALAFIVWSLWQDHRPWQATPKTAQAPGRTLPGASGWVRDALAHRWHEGDVAFLRDRRDADTSLREGQASEPRQFPCLAVPHDNQVVLLDLDSGSTRAVLTARALVRWPRIAPDGRSLAAWIAAPNQGTAALAQWDLATGSLLIAHDVAIDEVVPLQFDGRANVLMWRTDQAAFEMNIVTGTVERLGNRRASDLDSVVSASQRMRLYFREPDVLWIDNEELPLRLGLPSAELRTAAFSGDERWLAVADTEGRLYVCDCPQGIRMRAFDGITYRLALDAHGERLLTLGSADALVHALK
ncbi:MAG: hypothetical protein AB8H80_09740 [Planctomycetota bacterium]